MLLFSRTNPPCLPRSTCLRAHKMSKVPLWLQMLRLDTSFLGISRRHYLLFSLLRSVSLPSHQNGLKTLFGRLRTLLTLESDHISACTTTAWRLPPFHTRAGCSESPSVSSVFRYTLDEFGTARRCAVVRGFIDALTRGGPGGTPRPIEMHSHDPLRYISEVILVKGAPNPPHPPPPFQYFCYLIQMKTIIM